MTLQLRKRVVRQVSRPALPGPIQDMMTQLGRGKMWGAFAQTGGTEITYSCRGTEGSKVDTRGVITAGTWVRWRVNAGPNRKVYIIVTLEPSDTYTVRLFKTTTAKGKAFNVLYEMDDVYCDVLNDIANKLYDDYAREHMGGIPLW